MYISMQFEFNFITTIISYKSFKIMFAILTSKYKTLKLRLFREILLLNFY